MSDHDHDHDHPWFLGHHWNNARQQFDAGKFGMWLFLATEVLLFGGLFCAYAIWRGNHPDLFKYGSQFLDTTMGAINTAVLITSSLTMAMAVTFAQQGKQKALKICLILTFMGAVGFLVIKYFEYTHKFHEGWYPGLKFYERPSELSHTFTGSLVTADVPVAVDAAGDAAPADGAWMMPGTEASTVAVPPEGPSGLSEGAMSGDHGDHGVHGDQDDLGGGHAEDASHAGDGHGSQVHPLDDPNRPPNTHMFFTIYFMMTGLHGVHVVIGMIVIGWIFWKSLDGKFGPDYFTPVDLGGLYWHVVDLIWIFLFPLFYLI